MLLLEMRGEKLSVNPLIAPYYNFNRTMKNISKFFIFRVVALYNKK